MALANKAQEAMNEKPNDGKEEGEKAGSDLSDSDQEGKQNNGTELNLNQKVDALFEAAGTTADGKLDIKEAKPMLQKLAQDLLGMDEGEASDALMKNLFDEIDTNQDGKVEKGELLEHLKQLEQE